MQHMTFEDWWKSLKSIAEDNRLSFLLSDDKEDHRQSYEDGNTPRMEMQDIYNGNDC